MKHIRPGIFSCDACGAKTRFSSHDCSPLGSIRRPCRPNRTDCANIVGNTGDNVGHACGGCSGGQFTSVWECRLYGDCAPLAWAPLKADGVHVRRCCDCAAYAATT